MTFKYIEKSLKNKASITANKAVVLSDLHLGGGALNDNALGNSLYLISALRYYLVNGFVLVLNGDIFEIAENNKIENIKIVHYEIMELFEQFAKENRLIYIKGNHDQAIKSKDLAFRRSPISKNDVQFLDINIYDSVQLNEKFTILHGHQTTFWFDGVWNNIVNWFLKIGWTVLERFVFKDPTKESTGFDSANEVDKVMQEWASKNNTVVIAGHTHSVFITPHKYYNLGCGVMPRCITCAEIVDDNVEIVKWYSVVKDSTVHINRERV